MQASTLRREPSTIIQPRQRANSEGDENTDTEHREIQKTSSRRLGRQPDDRFFRAFSRDVLEFKIKVITVVLDLSLFSFSC